MNKLTFLEQLEKGLSKLPMEERNDILRDYEEHFVNAMEVGKSESEICASLGMPRQIVKEIMAEYHIEKIKEQPNAGNILNAMLAAFGLGFLNLVFVLGPFIALMGILFTGWVIGIAFVATLPLFIVTTIVQLSDFSFYSLFNMITLMGLGILILIGMYYVTRVFVQLFVRYLKYNLSIVKRGLS